MLVFRVGKVMALWGSVLVLSTHAYFRSVAASTIDSRLLWGLPVILGALLLGHLLALAVPSARRRRLDADQHGLSLLVAAICLEAFSHVEAHTSIRVLREEVPQILGWIYPTMVLLTPLGLKLSSSLRSAADQGLWISLSLCSLSGAVVLLSAPAALCLGFIALVMQFDDGGGRVQRSPLLLFATLVVGLLLLSSWVGLNPLHAAPSRAWILAAASTGLAIAVRPRKRADWRWILSAPLATALLIALSALLLTVYLGVQVDWLPALRTRLTVFRQHPNFLAPFLAFQSLVALGLALSERRFRLTGLACSALLAASTVMTDSRTGIGALALALLTLPILYGLARLSAKLQRRLAWATLVGAPLLLGGVLWSQQNDSGESSLLQAASKLERFDASMEYRVDAWWNSIDIIKTNPLLGIGPGTFVSVRRFQPGSRFFNEPESPHPHNVLLYVGQAAGIPAALLSLAWLLALLKVLWTGFGSGSHEAPRFLLATLIAATVGLAAASCLDLGLSLQTVLPAPIFVLTGLALGSATLHERRRREGPALLWTLPLALLMVPDGLQAIRARSDLEQAKLMWYLAGQRRGDADQLRDSSREVLAQAIQRDPDLAPAYDLLARWTENADGGFLAAKQVLEDLVQRAETYGPSLSLLGHLYMRHGMYTEASTWLERGLACSHGSVHLTRDRADVILSLARLGQRQECLEQIASALRLGSGVVDELPFVWRAEIQEYLLTLGGDPSLAPIRLSEAAEILFARNIALEEATQPVGRQFWMATYNAYRRADKDSGAADVLNYIEQHQIFDEPHTLAYERGRMKLDAEDLEGALELFETAADVAPSTSAPYFRMAATDVRRLQGKVTEAAEQTADAFAATGEILDRPMAFLESLELQSSVALAKGDAASAAQLLERTLLYEDELEARAARWERVGDLYRLAGDGKEGVRAYGEALVHLNAKPFGLPNLQLGQVRSIPGRIAQSLCSTWREMGLDQQGIQEAAWGLPDFFSPRTAWSLLRMALYYENGQPDALLREADLQLLRDGHNGLALWARLDALEGLGQWNNLRDTMRDLAEQFAVQYSVEEVYRQAVISGASRAHDPDAWFEIAILNLLRGRYQEAADMFGNALERTEGAPHAAAHLLGWQARATYLADSPRARRAARALLQQGLEQVPDCGMLRARLEGLPE